MEYPEDVLTRNQRGEKEVRNLLSKGEFVKYNYTDPKTGKIKEGGKFSLVLKSKEGKEHYFMIPVKGGRFLVIPQKVSGLKKVWDGKKVVGV